MDSDSKRITRLTKIYSAIGALKVKQISRQLRTVLREQDRAIEKTKQDLISLKHYRRVNTRFERHIIAKESSNHAALISDKRGFILDDEEGRAISGRALISRPSFEYDRYVTPVILDARNRLQRLYLKKYKNLTAAAARNKKIADKEIASNAIIKNGASQRSKRSAEKSFEGIDSLQDKPDEGVTSFPSLEVQRGGRLAAARSCLKLGGAGGMSPGDTVRRREPGGANAQSGSGRAYRASVSAPAGDDIHRKSTATSNFDKRRSLFAAVERSIGLGLRTGAGSEPAGMPAM